MRLKLFILLLIWTSGLSYGKSSESQSSSNEVKVVGISSHTIGLNDVVRLKVQNGDSLFLEARELNKKVVPYFNNLPLNDLRVIQLENDSVKFYLRRNNASNESWKELIQHKKDFYSASVSISIGMEGEQAVKTIINDAELMFIRKFWLYVCLFASAVTLAAFIVLAFKTNIIRDSGPEPSTGLKPFSIGKAQMAFWFFLVVSTYPILWLITGEASEITGSILVLLGISSATALGATAIDSNKISQLQDKLQKGNEGEESIDERISKLQELLNKAKDTIDIDNLNTRLQDLMVKKAEVEKLNTYNTSIIKGRKSKTFFRDILSDNTGFSFHRFQILVWTLVLGVFFIIEVVTNLQMPQFDDTTLALMGISSGTYIGFKFPEKQPE